MNQSLMKRLRRKLKDDYCKDPLIGNIFFKKDSDEIFEIDECIFNSDLIHECQFNIFEFPKTRSDSWNRLRRAGVLDKMFNESEKSDPMTLEFAKVLYDAGFNKFIIYHSNELNDLKIKNIIDKMRLKDKNFEIINLE